MIAVIFIYLILSIGIKRKKDMAGKQSEKKKAKNVPPSSKKNYIENIKKLGNKKRTLAISGAALVILIIVSLLIIPQVYTKDRSLEIIQNNFQYDSEFIMPHIVEGGPKKDGIPSIDVPQYISAEEADSFLAPEDIVVGVIVNNRVLAYPAKIMAHHEIVNDNTGEERFSVTYCPLTRSAVGYLGRELGVTGQLYNSNLVMYDRETGSRIPQMLGMAIDGPIKDQFLTPLQTELTAWQRWKAVYPETKVLSPETGLGRNYKKNPYQNYEGTEDVWFSVVAKNDHFSSKKVVTGIELDGHFFAVPKQEMGFMGWIQFPVEDQTLHIVHDKELNVVRAYRNSIADENRLHTIDGYWFAWFAYHPDTEVIDIKMQQLPG